MENWLLLSNCQTVGLANSIRLMSSNINVVAVDHGQYSGNVSGYNSTFSNYDRIIITQEIESVAGADFSSAQRVSYIPPLSFSAYHPDLVYLFCEGKVLSGPLDAYHSNIVFVAHRHGLGVDDTVSLFTSEMYERCGYYDQWVPQRDGVIWYFSHFGMDVAQAIRHWGRSGSFMYSTNHPRIRCVYDIARLFLMKEGYDVQPSDVLPHDNLANSSCFPVYTEIGEALGVEGSYLFKRCADYSQIGLRQFVTESFAAYDAYRDRSVTVTEQMQPFSDRISALL